MPAPVTRPPVPIVATPVLLLLHVPPGVPSVRVVVPPKQMVTTAGLMAVGVVLTVTVAIA